MSLPRHHPIDKIHQYEIYGLVREHSYYWKERTNFLVFSCYGVLHHRHLLMYLRRRRRRHHHHRRRRRHHPADKIDRIL